jgi:PAS domain S-box-containing protein
MRAEPRRADGPRPEHVNLWGWGAALALVLTFLALGLSNIVARATWHEVEDGVLWASRPEGVVAAEIATGSPAAVAAVRQGDVLLAIDGRPVDSPADVVRAAHQATRGSSLKYTLLRFGSERLVDVRLAPVVDGKPYIYFALASVGMLTLLIGGAVRLRRPSDPATLHFFWLCLAFFGVFTFSFSGRLDRLDWVFYWADAVATLLLPPLFLHFTLEFPDRPDSLIRTRFGSRAWPLLYAPALLLGAARVVALSRMEIDQRSFAFITTLERVEPLYLSVWFIGGLVVLIRALLKVRSLTGRRQLRWIVWGTALGAAPFAISYAVPFTLGFDSAARMEISAIPLGLIPMAFACAIVRYRLMDVEVIIKRGLVYIVAIAAIGAIYAVLLQTAGWMFFEESQERNTVIAILATLVMVLLARPVKNTIQTALDRAFYRDKYDYRRALVGFARDLSTDLDLARLAERLVARVSETLVIDRIALMLGADASSAFYPIRTVGFGGPAPPLPRSSGVGGRVGSGHRVALDDPAAARRFDPDEVEFWRAQGIHYFIPCVSKDATIAVMALGRKESGELLSSEDLALLGAVAGQVATSLENGRLYGELSLKADELERLRQFNENILESLDDGLIVLDADHRIVRCNRALEQLYGIGRHETIGRSLEDLFGGEFVVALEAARQNRPDGATLYRIALSLVGSRPDNTQLVNASIVPLRPLHGEPGVESRVTGWMVILEDVASRVRLEEQLQIAEKMASIGLLAAGVAHEVNTPLTGISSYTQMLLKGADPHDPRTALLEKIERQTFRAAKIVNGLLALSRSSGPMGNESAPVDLNIVISDVLALLEHQLKAVNIQLRRDLVFPPPIVFGVEHKLQQVFLNLFINARDAMPKGGWLSISTRIEGASAVAEVSDTGSGIPNEHLSRIYDPFFTTKAIGQGTGLGLSITYGIVREHQGSIACDSTSGEGTRFTLTLPLASAVAEHSTRVMN